MLCTLVCLIVAALKSVNGILDIHSRIRVGIRGLTVIGSGRGSGPENEMIDGSVSVSVNATVATQCQCLACRVIHRLSNSNSSHAAVGTLTSPKAAILNHSL